MLIAGFGVQPLSFDPHGHPSLSVTWNGTIGGVVHITAHSLKPGVFYQMDAEAPGDSREYKWPLDYLKKSDLGAGEVSLVAWTRMPVANTSQKVFLPVNVSSVSESGVSAPFKLMVIPPVELSIVTKTVREVSAAGLGRAIETDIPVGTGYYPSERSFDIDLPRNRHGGLYQVFLSARVKGGGTASAVLYIFSPADARQLPKVQLKTNAKK